ncbi:MAG TPA: DEAD/DEAH box helicase, partial [Anaerolineales bacterium]|nr:DEAD/DEAH box helicase [Anaerolineales bacterium]
MSLQQLLSLWKYTPQIAENIAHWETIPPRQGRVTDLPRDLHPGLVAALHQQGIHALYLHQSQAWEHTRAGKHVVIATGTASGKTLAYNLPILDRLLRDPEARALYLFPTKALAQDQLEQISKSHINNQQITQSRNLHSPISDEQLRFTNYPLPIANYD